MFCEINVLIMLQTLFTFTVPLRFILYAFVILGIFIFLQYCNKS